MVKKPVTEKCTPAVYNPTYNTYTPGGSYSYQYGRYIANYCSPASKRVTAVRSGYYKKTTYNTRYRKRRTTTVKIRDNRTYCRPTSYCTEGGGGGVIGALIICCCFCGILAIGWKVKKGKEVEEGHVVEEEVLVKEGYEQEVVVEPGQQIVENVVVEHREDVVEEFEHDVEVPEDWVEGQPIPPQKG